MNWIKTALKALLILAAVLGTFAALLKYASVPYAWIALESLILLSIAAVKVRSQTMKAVAFNLAFTALALGAAEVYMSGACGILSGKQPCITIKQGEGSFYTSFYNSDELRGYTAKPLQHARSKLTTLDHQVIYDVVYSTDQYGLRVTPPNDNPNSIPILFFGCSFTFGDGVNDDEALPYVFQVGSKNEYKAYNFALNGYGPHQMLRIIESGLIERVLGKSPDVAIYGVLTDHIERCNGNYPYDVSGPKYVLNDKNEVEFAGKLDESKAYRFMLHQLDKSYVIRRILLITLSHKRTTKDIDLFIGILAKSRDLLMSKYNCRFYVLVWTWGNEEDKDVPYIRSELEKKNIRVIATKDIFTKFNDGSAKYYLHECDGHPSALAYKRVSDYLLDYVHNAPYPLKGSANEHVD